MRVSGIPEDKEKLEDELALEQSLKFARLANEHLNKQNYSKALGAISYACTFVEEIYIRRKETHPYIEVI